MISKITVQIVSSEWSSLTNPSKNISEFIRFVSSNCNLGKTIISYNTWTFFRLQDQCQHNFNQYHLGCSLMTPRTAEIGKIHRTTLECFISGLCPWHIAKYVNTWFNGVSVSGLILFMFFFLLKPFGYN